MKAVFDPSMKWQLVEEYIKLLSSPGNASDHFWELDKRIKRDRKHPGVIIELRKSEAIWDIAIQFEENMIYTEIGSVEKE